MVNGIGELSSVSLELPQNLKKQTVYNGQKQPTKSIVNIHCEHFTLIMKR